MSAVRLMAFHALDWLLSTLDPSVPDYPVRLLILRNKLEVR